MEQDKDSDDSGKEWRDILPEGSPDCTNIKLNIEMQDEQVFNLTNLIHQDLKSRTMSRDENSRNKTARIQVKPLLKTEITLPELSKESKTNGSVGSDHPEDFENFEKQNRSRANDTTPIN